MFAAALMIAAAIMWVFGIEAAQRSLEDTTSPLSSEPSGTGGSSSASTDD